MRTQHAVRKDRRFAAGATDRWGMEAIGGRGFQDRQKKSGSMRGSHIEEAATQALGRYVLPHQASSRADRAQAARAAAQHLFGRQGSIHSAIEL